MKEESSDENSPETKRCSKTEERRSIVIRFAGDSGDGIQTTGTHFTTESAFAGNDIATLPNYPSEIRAPAGTLAGVSGFQINFGSKEIFTPGDNPDVLVALNPAALRANLEDVPTGGILILNKDAFTEKNLEKVGYNNDPCEDHRLTSAYQVYVVPISSLTKQALKGSKLPTGQIDRCKNFFALGLTSWMFNRPMEPTLTWIEKKFGHLPELVEANTVALNAGYAYGSSTQKFPVQYVVKPASLKSGIYRNISGSLATAYGLTAAAQKSGLPLFYGAYPITPASDILHELSKHKRLGVTTFQAEDEIAAVCAALGAAYAGHLAVTGSSGPGIALKTEALGLAVITELPLVIINVQRAGPSTGMPTKTEQTDLFQALHGRNGEAPMCVLAASNPKTAFTMTYEACRIALKYMTPVFLLSEGYIANTAAPWRIPDPDTLPEIEVPKAKKNNNGNGHFLPYVRDKKTLARPWPVPGMKGMTHRIGGLEKEDETGCVSHDPENHHKMCTIRAEKIERIAADLPPTTIRGEQSGDLLVIGWGGSEGAIREAASASRAEGLKVSSLHLFYLNPLPRDLGEIMKRFKHVLVPEINFGQLQSILRARYLLPVKGYNRVTGQPFKVSEIKQAIAEVLQQGDGGKG